MLSLYLNKLRTSHKCVSMFSKLNELPLQKTLQPTKHVFWTKSKKTQQKNKKQTYNSLPEPGIEPVTSCTPTQFVRYLRYTTKSIEHVDWSVLFNCINVKTPHLRAKQSRCSVTLCICDHSWITKVENFHMNRSRIQCISVVKKSDANNSR